MESKSLQKDKIIGQRVRKFRLIAGMTQKELATKLCVTAQQLQKYESGRNKISASRIEIISAVLDVPLINFFDVGKNDSIFDIKTPIDKSSLKLIRLYSKISSKKLQELLLHSADVYSTK